MKAPHVTIIIPTYNRADYLSEAIASALGQTYYEIEVIVVDDGSTDTTPEIVAKITDPRLVFIRQSNRGVSAALNTGVNTARGEYIAMLGSDDVMLPEQISTLLALIDPFDSVGVVHGRGLAMDGFGRDLPQTFGAPLKFPGRPLASMLYADTVCVIACLIRRRLVEQVGGFDENLVANEDWDLLIRLAPLCQFLYCDRILARYRMHGSSLTGNASVVYERVVRGRIALVEDYYRNDRVPEEARAVKTLALRNVYMDAMIRYLTLGRNRTALEYFARALGTGGNPITTAARMISVAMFDLYFSKTRLGVRVADHLVARRRPA